MVISVSEDSLVTAFTRISDSFSARSEAVRDSASICPVTSSELRASRSISSDSVICSLSARRMSSSFWAACSCWAAISASRLLPPSSERAISSRSRS